MPDQISAVISTTDRTIRQFDHVLGTVIRSLCSYNASWSPFYSTNFDPSTGLPLAFALGPTEVSNPTSLASDEWSVYVLDPYTCRVLRFDASVGDLHATFGGKRGIGTGRISPDNTLRSVIALANNKVFITDNDNGSGGSGTGFVVQFSRDGVWQADYSIATWITALTAQATFDQVTGWAWDAARGVYWALAQGVSEVYLFSVTAAGVVTGDVINLTTRLASSLAFTIAGHSGTTAGRIKTRGLKYFNGFLYFWSETYAIRVDLAGTSGDRLIATGSANLAPGHLNGAGTELSHTLTNAAQGVNMVRVITLATLTVPSSERSYGIHDTIPEDGTNEISNPWDVSVTPYSEDTSTEIARQVTVRARIRGTTTRTCQARAVIHNTVPRTVTARCRILDGFLVQCTARAAIDEPHTLADRSADWSVSQDLGSASRQFSLSAPEALFQTGDEVRIKAGYDRNRITLMEGMVDQVSKDVGPGEIRYQIVGRDLGARKLETQITKTWASTPRKTMPRAHQIAREIIEQQGLQVGVLEFPDYDLHNSFQSIGSRVIDILTQLLEPWNIFGRVKYFPVIRDNLIHILKIDFANPPATGYPVLLQHRAKYQQDQVDYLDEPRLNEVDFFFIRGAAWTEPRADLGVQTRIEYFRNVINDPSIESVFGVLGETVTTETTVIETVYGDKVLSRQETITAGLKLISRTEDRYSYIEPGESISGLLIPASPASISYSSGAPSENALLLGTNSRRWGIVSVTQGGTSGNSGSQTTFREVFRSLTTYYYDTEGQVAAEGSAIQEFDEDVLAWKKTRYTMRTHSQTTGGSLRTQLTNFVFEDSEFQLDSVDVQQIGGSRAEIANPGSRKNLVTHQAQAPQGEIDNEGNVIDPGERHYIWSFENPYIGQSVCDTLYQQTLDERIFQLQRYRWDKVPFESVLNPGIYVGQPVRIQMSVGVYKDYWVMQVTHNFSHQQAMTSGSAWRLTQEDL